MRFSDAVFRSGFSVIDTHCHLNLEPLWENWQSHLLSAKKRQVNFWWIPGTNLETSRRAITIASQEASCFPFIGIHPTEVAESDLDAEYSVKRLANLKQEADSLGVTIAGIGEIGLDYFRLADDDFASRQDQRMWFRLQLDLALSWDVPVILHVRDRETPDEPSGSSMSGNAYWDVLRIFEELAERGSLPREFTLHCVSGPEGYVRRMVELGAYCGFDGNLTYPNAHHIRALWRLVPPDRRLLETDAPYLPPQNHRGSVCEPWMIAETAVYAAGLMG